MLDGGTKDYDELEDGDEQEVAAKEQFPFLIIAWLENIATEKFLAYRLLQLTGEFSEVLVNLNCFFTLTVNWNQLKVFLGDIFIVGDLFFAISFQINENIIQFNKKMTILILRKDVSFCWLLIFVNSTGRTKWRRKTSQCGTFSVNLDWKVYFLKPVDNDSSKNDISHHKW